MGLGYPLVVVSTRTEDDDVLTGDRIYCPFTAIENKGKLILLSQFHVQMFPFERELEASFLLKYLVLLLN